MPNNKQLLKDLNAQLTKLKTELAAVHKAAGIDEHITVTPRKSQAHATRIRVENGPDKATGVFFITIDITAKSETVYIPLSVASGVRPTGFMYQIEGTGAGSIKTTDITCRGDGVTQVTLGTLLYVKIPAGKTASFEIKTTIRGAVGKEYTIVVTRINYKLQLTDARYQFYLKEIPTTTLSIK